MRLNSVEAASHHAVAKPMLPTTRHNLAFRCQVADGGRMLAFMMRVGAAVLVVLGVVGGVTAAPASADNASYLAALSGYGSKTRADDLLMAGKFACGQLQPRPGLMFGLHPNVVADRVWQYNSAFERDEATAVVNAAIDNLCPGVNMLGHAG